MDGNLEIMGVLGISTTFTRRVETTDDKIVQFRSGILKHY